MNNNANRCAIFGVKGTVNHPNYDKIKKLLTDEILELVNNGITTFITEASDGYEYIAAKFIIDLKKCNPNIKLIVVKPYENFPYYWKSRYRVQKILESADLVKYIANDASDFCKVDLNNWIISHCTTVICVTNSADSHLYRIKKDSLKNKNTIFIPSKKSNVKANNNMSYTYPTSVFTPANINNIVISADQTPGTAWFNNYEELKNFIKEGLQIYNDTVYSPENISQAKEDLKTLKALHKKLTDKRKEIEKSYTLPIQTVIKQLDELISMVKTPYTTIDKMLKTNAKNIKKYNIMQYAKSKSELLGIYASNVINSKNFFNPRWCNVSYKDRDWKRDVDYKIESARNDIQSILYSDAEDKNLILGFYFDKLSFDGIEAFLNTYHSNNIGSEKINFNTGEIIEDRKTVVATPQRHIGDDKISYNIQITGNKEDIETYLKLADSFDISISFK